VLNCLKGKSRQNQEYLPVRIVSTRHLATYAALQFMMVGRWIRQSLGQTKNTLYSHAAGAAVCRCNFVKMSMEILAKMIIL
jgi:hypothetical protein